MDGTNLGEMLYVVVLKRYLDMWHYITHASLVVNYSQVYLLIAGKCSWFHPHIHKLIIVSGKYTFNLMKSENADSYLVEVKLYCTSRTTNWLLWCSFGYDYVNIVKSCMLNVSDAALYKPHIYTIL